MPKPWYTIKAAAEGSDVAEVSILEAISPWYGVDAKSFLTEFRALKASKVRLFLNSPGGSVTEALAIFNGMRATGKQIEVVVLGIAASAASYIAMAGDKISMPRNTLMFLHNPIGGVYGNAEEMRDYADVLDKMGVMLTATYAKRFKGEEAVLQQFMKDEALLTADECLKYGLCDEVTDEITATAEFDVDSLPPEARKVFEASAARIAQPPADPAPAALAPTLAEQISKAAADAGLAEFTAHFGGLATIEAAQARIAEAREMVALGKMFERPADVAAMIRAGKPLADARAELAETLAAASPQVKTTPSSKSAAGGPALDYSPTAIWRDIHAMKQKQH